MPRFRKLLHGIRKRLKPRKGQTVTADSAYEDGDDVDRHAHSTDSYQVPPNSVVSSTPPPSTASKQHRNVENQYSNSSSDNRHYNNNTEKLQPPTRIAPTLPSADPKPAKPANGKAGLSKSNMAILHDQNGYALVVPKSGNNGAAASGASSHNSNSRQNEFTVAHNANNNKNGTAAKVGVKPTLLPTKANEKMEAYCNIVLTEDKETKSFSNDLYEDTDLQAVVPKLPENTRPVVKAQETSQNSQLNYVEVEFVNPAEVTSKRPLKQTRSPSPTQYTDVINDNGVIRLKD